MRTLAMALRTASLCTLVPLVCGCGYLADRALDFTDFIYFGASTGGGVIVRAQATHLVSLELGARSDERMYGWRERHGIWDESSFGIFTSSFWSPVLGSETPPAWNGLDVIKTSHSKTAFGTGKMVLQENDPTRPLIEEQRVVETKHHLFILTKSTDMSVTRFFDVQVDASAVIGGVQVGISPGELVDFLLGFLTIDLAGDDGGGAAGAEPAAK
jgi:hypothetical protein